MTDIGFYPGSFDPVTLGHLDIIRRAASLFDRLVVGVGVHHGKAAIFTGEERVQMLEIEIAPMREKMGVAIDIITYSDLTVKAAQRAQAGVIVRGLREAGDFDDEMQMAAMNGKMAADIETIFLGSAPSTRHIAAKFVRQIARMGGDVTPFVSDSVAQCCAKLDKKIQ